MFQCKYVRTQSVRVRPVNQRSLEIWKYKTYSTQVIRDLESRRVNFNTRHVENTSMITST